MSASWDKTVRIWNAYKKSKLPIHLPLFFNVVTTTPMNEWFSDVFSVTSENLGASPRDRKRRRTHELPNTTSGAPLQSQRRLVGTMTFHDELEERRLF